MENEKYHQIEKILTDFKNGETYSTSIDKINLLLLEEREKALREVLEIVGERIKLSDPINTMEDMRIIATNEEKTRIRTAILEFISKE